MILAMVDHERQKRRELRMIIRPLSSDFIDSSPEEVSSCCYRLEPCVHSLMPQPEKIVPNEG